MKIVFISGPLTTGWDWKNKEFIRERVKEARKYQLALFSSGVACFCAHVANSNEDEVAPENFYLNMDLEFLKRCDAVLAMPGWDKSHGATKEVEIAKELGLPIFHPRSPEDIKKIIEWNREI